MAEITSLHIDKKDLDQIIKDLDNLFPTSDTKLRNTLRTAMRKAIKPAVEQMRTEIKKGLTPLAQWANVRGKRLSEAHSGQLEKSIAVISGKTSRGRHPKVYVGPRVKGAWSSKEKSGWYFYFLEHGSVNLAPRRILEKVVTAKGSIIAGSLVSSLKEVIGKRWAKKLG